jgi:hypothetical protein
MFASRCFTVFPYRVPKRLTDPSDCLSLLINQ